MEKIKLLPTKPGCYIMKNKDGLVIYVGKAINIKKRVASYFNKNQFGKTKKLVSEIDDIEYIVVENETEALILELNLIKKYSPKYNILLRDDKSYPYIELTKEKAPRLMVIRRLDKKKQDISRLYGPYPNVGAARTTVNLLNRIYPLRKCRTYPKKPCLYYHIDQCLAYCVFDIDDKKIGEIEKEIVSFLKGSHKHVSVKIRDEMLLESSKQNYEKAKELKELLDYIEVTLEKQKVEISELIDIDVLGYYTKDDFISIQVFFIRGGKIVESNNSVFELVGDIEDVVVRYVAKFYENKLIPKELLINVENTSLLESYLNTNVKTPIRGRKKYLVDMAIENAKSNLKNKIETLTIEKNKTENVNNELGNVLKIENLSRIEIFDNSTLFGKFAVSGMVVFEDGRPLKKEYRKFKVEEKHDDYGSLREVIYRRYFRVLMDDLKKPDLIMVDGGVGQVNVAREVINDLNLKIPVVGIKKDDKHRTNALLAFEPLEEVKIDSELFKYISRIQDEVHRFTINYHRQLRSKGSLESILDDIPGIGKVKKEKLLLKYKNINAMREASIEELEAMLTPKVAREFLKQLGSVENDKN